MTIDEYGIISYTTDDLCDLLYQNQDIDLAKFSTSDEEFNRSIDSLYLKQPLVGKYTKPNMTLEEYDRALQQRWRMPAEYKSLDIVEHVIGLCKTDAELERVAMELQLYVDYGLENLLRFCKYFVDVTTAHGIVIGVGRGSSVSSYVLFLLGVHKIDSIKYGLDVKEFLKG